MRLGVAVGWFQSTSAVSAYVFGKGRHSVAGKGCLKMTRSRDQAIDKIVGDQRVGNDLSLRGKALARALKNEAPRTMTAWEWEEWYAQYGVPTEHRKSETGGWWQRVFRSSSRAEQEDAVNQSSRW
jgi:hypothetical protein